MKPCTVVLTPWVRDALIMAISSGVGAFSFQYLQQEYHSVQLVTQELLLFYGGVLLTMLAITKILDKKQLREVFILAI